MNPTLVGAAWFATAILHILERDGQGMQTTYEPQTAGIIEPSSQQGGYGIGCHPGEAAWPIRTAMRWRSWCFPGPLVVTCPGLARHCDVGWDWLFDFCSCNAMCLAHVLQQVKCVHCLCAYECIWIDVYTQKYWIVTKMDGDAQKYVYTCTSV